MAEPAGALYFIREELEAEFFDEVKFAGIKVQAVFPGIYFSAIDRRLFWVLDYWPVTKVQFTSISDAAKKLKAIGKRWAYAGGENFRRGGLIAEAVRCRPLKHITFASAALPAATGAFTLQDKETMLVSTVPLKGAYASGKMPFVEDKLGPPSRAYLKLYEVLTLTGLYPGISDTVLDLGATPGGWSYVAANLGAKVTMIDRSEPDAGLFRKFSELQFIRGDGLNPPVATLEAATMILSDMACEPAKLLVSVKEWLRLPNLKTMINTLKFHGLSDKKLIQQFAAIEGSCIYHLWHNGHELTWVWHRR